MFHLVDYFGAGKACYRLLWYRVQLDRLVTNFSVDGLDKLVNDFLGNGHGKASYWCLWLRS